MFPVTCVVKYSIYFVANGKYPFISKRLLYGVKRNPTRVRKMERPTDEDLQPTDPTHRQDERNARFFMVRENQK
jgi:hypothetical protein